MDGSGSICGEDKPSLLARIFEWRLRCFEEALQPPGKAVLPSWAMGLLSPMLSRRMIEEIQVIRLRRTVALAAHRSPFYRELLSRNGLEIGMLRSPRDLASLPFTTADDLAEPDRFLCVPWEEVGHIFATSGTTGEPKRVYFTFRDLGRIVNVTAAAMPLMARMGLPLPSRLVALIALPQGLWIGSHQVQRVIERLGGLAIKVGMPSPSHAFRHMARFRPNTLVTSPSYLRALTRTADDSERQWHIPLIFLSGEALHPDEAHRFASFWGGAILNAYGTTEIGGGQAFALPGCRALHVNELHVLAEIVDVHAGRESERGELVFTTLAREAMPLLRYRSGDLGRWVRCDCGIPFRSFVVEGRTNDMFVAGDLNFYGRVIAEAVARIEGASGRVVILLDKVDTADRLTLRVERLPGHDVAPEEVRLALLDAYPDVYSSLEAGILALRIEVVDYLEPMAKTFRIADARAAEV